MKNLFHSLIAVPARVLAALVRAYQILLSPDHSWLRGRFPYGYCRHYPSCSEYTRLALLKHGLFKGLYLGAIRLSHCHPWAHPSVDPVP